MKLRLPFLLLNSVLACFISAGVAQAISISSNTTYSQDTEWTEATTIGANDLTLTIDTGITVTQQSGGFNIGNNNLTLTGGGTLKINTAATVKISSESLDGIKTLTIDGMTLDLSNPAAKLSLLETSDPNAYTRLYLVVKNAGVVKVDKFTYDGSFGACELSTNYFKLDNGTIQISNENDSAWQYGLGILSGGGTVENSTAGKTVTMASNANTIASGAFLTLSGVGNFNAGTTANFLTGAGGVIKDGSGTLTIGVDQNFQGGMELKSGTLVASTANALGTNKVLKVTGNATLGGVSAALSGLTLGNGVSLNVASVDNNAGLILNGKLDLQGTATMTGNLNIGRGNTLSLTNQPVSGAPVMAITGTLTLEGTLLLESMPSFVWVADSTYDVISATSVSGSLSNNLLLSDTVYGKWVVSGNNLQLKTFNLETLTWAGGGNATWALNGTTADSPWTGTSVYTDVARVIFGDVAGSPSETVTIAGVVTPIDVEVNASSTDYIWNGTGKLAGTAALHKSGTGSLVINTANDGYSGQVTFGGGTIEMGTETALGAGVLLFDGGTLRYGTGITKDVSGQIGKGAGISNVIRVDTNGNNVSWATTLADRDYEKSGAGTLTLSPADGTNFTNSITVNGGELALSASTGSVRISGNMNGSGTLIKEGGANLFITSTSNNFSGILEVKGGTTVVGAASMTGTGSDATLGANATIIVDDGASFRTHLGGENKTFAFGNAYLKSGSSIGNIDGYAAYTGNIHFNVDTIAADGSATYNASGSVSLLQYYAKTIGLNGIIAGSGIVNLISDQEDTGKDHRFVLSNTGNTFNGTYVLESQLLTTIELGASDTDTGGVAKDAQFRLGSQKACLVISSEFASIGGLEGTQGTVSAEGGNRVLTINQTSGDKVFAGTLADTANGATGAVLSLVKDGEGKLTLDQNNTYTGDTTVKKGILAMGAGKDAALGTGHVFLQGGVLDMNGTAMANALTITGGNLSGAANYAGADHSVVINLDTSHSSLNLGGLLAAKVSSVSTSAAGALVRGLGEGSLQLGDSTLAVGANNLFHVTDDVYPGGADYIVGLSDASSTVSMSGGAVLTLDLRDADLVAAMAASGSLTYQILVTNGLLNMDSVNLENAGGTFQFVAVDGGNVVISGDTSNIYAVATNQEKTISSNEGLDAYNAVLVNGKLNLNLPGVVNADDGLVLKNLNGKASGVINVTRTGTTGTASVILNVTDETAIFNGTLNGGTANFVKIGAGTQIFGGASDMNSLVMKEGYVELRGGTLSLLGDGSKLETGTELKGSGQLVLNRDLTVEDGAVINGVNVTLNGANALLDIGTSDSSVSGLNGTGTLKADNGSLTIMTSQGATNTFSGSLSGTGSLDIAGAGRQILIGGGSSEYDLAVGGGASVLVRGTSDVPGVSYKSLNVNSGTFVLEAIGSSVSDSNSYLTLASGGSIASGGTLAFVVNTDYPGVLVSTSPSLIKTQGTFTLESGSLVDVSSIDPNANLTNDASSSLTLVLIEGVNGGSVQMNDGVGLRTSGLFDAYYEDTMLKNIDGDLVLTGKVREGNYFTDAGTTANSSAAADLIWNNRKGLSNSSELGKLMAAAATAVKEGNLGEAGRVMAASVGSTVTSLLSAQRGSFRQQQMWIRNRTTQMGVNQGVVNEDMPYVNAWIQGNGSYGKLDTNGDESGYSLNSWGGTAGVDIDMNESLTFGTAFTADYGKLKATAADVASGDMDSYYVNLFARLQHKNWAHTLILTGAWTDSTLNRTVSYEGGGYTTHGDTSGSTWGAMYEGTYDIVLNDRKTSIFQPVLNAGLYSSRVDGYQETGAGNAGLDVGKMDETYGSLAVGARLMGIVGTNILGRSCLGEVRMMVAQDMGDVSRSASIGYLNNPAIRANVVGAKLGRTALQIGAGLSIPVGERSSVFADANADIRSGSNSVNGNIGYRYNF